MTLETLFSLLVLIMFFFGILSYIRTFNAMSLIGPIILSAFLSFAGNVFFNKEDLKKPIFVSNSSIQKKIKVEKNNNFLKNKKQEEKVKEKNNKRSSNSKNYMSYNTVIILIIILFILFMLFIFYFFRKKAQEREIEIVLNRLRESSARSNNSNSDNNLNGVNNQERELEKIIKYLDGESDGENKKRENIQLKNNDNEFNNESNIDFRLNEKTTNSRKLSI